MDITDHNAFEVLQEVLAGRLQVEPDARASKTLLLLTKNDSDTIVTNDGFTSWHESRRGRSRSKYFRRTSPAVFSMLMLRAELKAVTEPTLIRFPAGRVPKIDYMAWEHGSKLVWVLVEPHRVSLKIRAAAGDWVEPSSMPAPEGGPLEPNDLEAWLPEEQPFDPSKPCPHCGTTKGSYRDYETYCVCVACGRSYGV